jgi:hypothetical protein
MTITLDLNILHFAERHLFVHSIFNVIVIHRLDHLKHIRSGLDILKRIRSVDAIDCLKHVRVVDAI